ncbi:MAG: DUF1080 domain-containing protein [Pirellulales bacterium]
MAFLTSLPFRAALAFLLLALLAPAARAAEQNTLTPAELADGWILLFDGETLFGWEGADKADWHVEDGAIKVTTGEKGLLATTSEFGDYVLRVDFRAPASTNSGVFLRTPPQPTNPEVDCYELNIAGPGVSPFTTGGFVARQKAEGAEHTGEWQTFEVRAEGAKFTVALDGRQVLEYTDPKPIGRGRIGLQLNAGPVEFRNVKLKPLGLEPLFNGRDLTGWTVFPGGKSVFSVTPEGWIHIENGAGQLESAPRFGDFVFQCEAFVNGKGLNSGVFFRSIPGEKTNGYESQIHNAVKDGDRTKPADGGTGAIYRRQNARKVVSDDFQWLSKTILATGPHIAVWVNGIQVTDWTDTRPPHDNPRQGLRLAPGTFILQGHDPTTNLSFRNLRAGEMAK